jgi:hypothetical protein
MFTEESQFKVWQVVAGIVGIWFFRKFARFLIYRFRIMKNKGNANRMLADRNNKTYSFDPVDPKVAEMLLTMDVHGVR